MIEYVKKNLVVSERRSVYSEETYWWAFVQYMMGLAECLLTLHHKLGPPSPPSGLTARVNTPNVELSWIASADEDVDFYRVTVYRMESGIPNIFRDSWERDTHERIVLYRTGVFIANVSSCNRCGQMSQGNATMSFAIPGKYINPFLPHHCVHVSEKVWCIAN